VLQLEQKAKKHDTLTLLRRHYNHQQQQQQEDDHDLLMDDPTNLWTDCDYDCIGKEEDDQTEKLLELMTMLEIQGDDNPDADKQLAELLAKSPDLKAAFEASLQNGQIQQLSLVLQPWDPWWNPVLSSSAETEEDSTLLSDHQTETANKKKTLDERLLQIKSLDKLLVLPKKKGKKSVLPDLTYNLMEIVYCTAYVLRLYHGVVNATSDDETGTEAAMTIIQTFSVLNQDSRYSCVEQVMMDITTTQSRHFTSTSNAQPTGTDCGVHHPTWMTLVLDMAAIMENRRMIGRALLEVLDILKTAIAALKKKRSVIQQQSPVDTRTHNNKDVDTLLTDLRRKRKKIDYFLSWSQHPAAKTMIPEQLSNDICAWLDHWKPEPKLTDPSNNPHASSFVEELLCVATTGRNETISLAPPGRDNERANLIEVLD
jgi:hypothetical protein